MTREKTTPQRGNTRAAVDLTPAAATELDRIHDLTGMNTADIFRTGLSLLRIYVNIKRDGGHLCTIDEYDRVVRIELLMNGWPIER
jgi:hypothetical protein